jgi:ankyrin repeat protein
MKASIHYYKDKDPKWINVCQFLVSLGSDVNALNTKGYSALCFAVAAGNLDICKFLIQNGADVTFEYRMWKDSKKTASLIQIAADQTTKEYLRNLIETRKIVLRN